LTTIVPSIIFLRPAALIRVQIMPTGRKVAKKAGDAISDSPEPQPSFSARESTEVGKLGLYHLVAAVLADVHISRKRANMCVSRRSVRSC